MRWIVCLLALVGLAACEKTGAKFKPGDRVVEKSDHTKRGIICLRFNTDEPYYYIKVPGKPGPVHDFPVWFDDSDKENLQVHIEGPFGEEDLEIAN